MLFIRDKQTTYLKQPNRIKHSIKKEQRGLHTDKRIVHEDIIIMNLYAPNNIALKYKT